MDLYKQAELIKVIREVHSQHADDLCWMDIDRIFAAADLPVPDRKVGDKVAMKKNCERFIDAMCSDGKWKSYAELEAEIVTLSAKVDELECTLDDEEYAHQETLRMLDMLKGRAVSLRKALMGLLTFQGSEASITNPEKWSGKEADNYLAVMKDATDIALATKDLE